MKSVIRLRTAAGEGIDYEVSEQVRQGGFYASSKKGSAERQEGAGIFCDSLLL